MPEIVAGLYQLKVPIPNNPIGYVLPYLIDGEGGYTLIDPGWNADESVESLKSQLGELGLSFRDLKRVIATHIHPDHYGMAGRMREEAGCEVILHEREVDFIRSAIRTPVRSSRPWAIGSKCTAYPLTSSVSFNFRACRRVGSLTLRSQTRR